ncbi:hypothetical protein G5V65_02015 [Rhodobacter sp. HX-7-19]|uniref:HPt domain-containing protein n=1 Tax=Paragemmobacter kunshanensis TaxID=2583234 RepID=A0A6M1TRG2_9RHOB|nr:Hpt domain-containing protein [Rhodobacter kunshanensis]NGQ89656.1 hypothetical protein [Rhodobacter kunshanensis]
MNAIDLRPGWQSDHPLAPAERLFRQMAAERLDILSRAWARLDSGQQVREAMFDIHHIAHMIAGTAGSLGHARIGLHAAEVERLSLEDAGREALLHALRPLISGLADLLED